VGVEAISAPNNGLQATRRFAPHQRVPKTNIRGVTKVSFLDRRAERLKPTVRLPVGKPKLCGRARTANRSVRHTGTAEVRRQRRGEWTGSRRGGGGRRGSRRWWGGWRGVRGRAACQETPCR
jgi:hypothetical protein